MDWLTWATYIAIFLVVWHEMHRFPEANRSFYKLQEKIEELEFIKEFQQEIIAEVELITGLDIAKKSLPEKLAKEIEIKKKNLSK